MRGRDLRAWLAEQWRLILATAGVAAFAAWLFHPAPPASPAPTPPLPTATPRLLTSPIAVPYPTALPPTPTPIAALRDRGRLLVPARLGDRTGIVALDADGGEQRVVADGDYQGAAWSPDGRWFLAYGREGVALYAADGQLARRYPLAGDAALRAYWAPDSRHVAVAPGGAAGPATTWLLDTGGGVRALDLGARTFPSAPAGGDPWSSTGVLALAVDGAGSGTPSPPRAIWTVGADGGAPRRLAEGDDTFAGWSLDGRTLYLLGDAAGGAPRTLFAVDGAAGARRALARADDLVGQLARPGTPAPATGDAPWSFAAAVPAPGGDGLAVWLAQPATYATIRVIEAPWLVVLDGAGRARWWWHAGGRSEPLYTAWSPDGRMLAASYGQALTGVQGGVVLLDTSGRHPPRGFALTDVRNADPVSLRWSPDGRTLALVQDRTLTILDVATGRRWPLLPAAGPPTWRPGA